MDGNHMGQHLAIKIQVGGGLYIGSKEPAQENLSCDNACGEPPPLTEKLHPPLCTTRRGTKFSGV
jgi:hypothetical protein